MKSQSQEGAFVVEEKTTQIFHKGKSFWQVVSAYHNGCVQIWLGSGKRFRACFKRQERLEGHDVLGNLNDPQVKLVMLVKSNLRYTILDLSVQKLLLGVTHSGYSWPL